MRVPSILWATVLSVGAIAPASAQSVQTGHATMDDGTRLHYEIVGEGEEVVVVPMAMYLSEALAPLAEGRRVVFYDPRNRGASDAADLATVSLDRQIEDLEQLREALGIERMALIGWSGLGMEMAVYAIRHPDRVTRLVQVSPVPPTAAMMGAGGDRRAGRTDQAAVAIVDSLASAGELGPEEHCRRRRALTEGASFEDPSLAPRVPNPCRYENEWPVNLWPYFDALLGSFGDYDWLVEIGSCTSRGSSSTAARMGSRWKGGGRGRPVSRPPVFSSYRPLVIFRSWNSRPRSSRRSNGSWTVIGRTVRCRSKSSSG